MNESKRAMLELADRLASMPAAEAVRGPKDWATIMAALRSSAPQADVRAALEQIIQMDDDAAAAHGKPHANLNGYGLVDLFDSVGHPFGAGEHKQQPYRSNNLEAALADARTALSSPPSVALEALETEVAGRIIDVMTGGIFDWRSRIDDSDFLNSADWQCAVSYARAALTRPQPGGDLTTERNLK